MRWKVALLLGLLAIGSTARADMVTSDFENLSLNPGDPTVVTLNAPNGSGQYVINASGSVTPTYDYSDPNAQYTTSSFTSGAASFNNSYINYNGGYSDWYGWGYSNVRDVADPGYDYSNFGFVNPVSAYNVPGGTGAGGSANYLVASDLYPGDAYINLAAGATPVSMQVTNTTWDALSMLNGDGPGGFGKKFSAAGNDFLKITLTGYSGLDLTGSAINSFDFYLADFRNGNAYVISQWTTVDLSSLAGSSSIGFAMSSSDNGTYGMNTPGFFAMDNFVAAVVPEPSSFALLALGAAGMILVRRNRPRA